MGKFPEGKAVSPENNIKKPTRWWTLYHLWGGICLKAYVDESGLSQFMLGHAEVSDPSSSIGVGSVVMLAVGSIALGYFLSKGVIHVVESGSMPMNRKIALKATLPIVYIAAAVVLAMATAPFFSM
jgi:hypothetical protein